MTKNWKKSEEGTYVFSVNEQATGTMDLSDTSMQRKAVCRLDGSAFVIRRSGFWKSTIEVSDQFGQMITRLSSEKWYGSDKTFVYKGKTYKLKVRNNPLAEYVVLNNTTEIASYGLYTENGKTYVRINTSNDLTDLFFDFLLWYVFHPLAKENGGDDLAFLLMAGA